MSDLVTTRSTSSKRRSYGPLFGLVGFILFGLYLSSLPSFILPAQPITSEFVLLIEFGFGIVIAVVLLWVGIITTVKYKGHKMSLGFLLCLIPPLGWFIALLLRNNQSSTASSITVPRHKFLWVSLIVLGISLGLHAISFLLPHKTISPEELENVKSTYAWLVGMGGHIGGEYRAIGMTGLAPGVYHELMADDARKNRLDSPWDWRSIDLHDTAVNDEDLSRLKIYKYVRFLNLNNTSISDAGLIHLHHLTHLKELELRNTKVSDVGVAELKKGLPNCTIHK